MSNEKLLEAIRTETVSHVSAAMDFMLCKQNIILTEDELDAIAEAIVAARPKPEDVADATVESFYEDRSLVLVKHCRRNWLAAGDRVTITREAGK